MGHPLCMCMFIICYIDAWSTFRTFTSIIGTLYIYVCSETVPVVGSFNNNLYSVLLA